MLDIIVTGNRRINCDPYIASRAINLIVKNLMDNGMAKSEIRIVAASGSSAETVILKEMRRQGFNTERKFAHYTDLGEAAYAIRNTEILNSESFAILLAFKVGDFGPDGGSDKETDALIQMAYNRFGTKARLYGVPRVCIYSMPEMPGMDNFEEFNSGEN